MAGIGDVCSYALMDINRYGDKRLASLNQSITEHQLSKGFLLKYLSLIKFKIF